MQHGCLMLFIYPIISTLNPHSLPMWTYSLLVQQSLMGFVAEPHPIVDALGEGIHFEHNVRAPSGSANGL